MVGVSRRSLSPLLPPAFPAAYRLLFWDEGRGDSAIVLGCSCKFTFP